MSDIKNLSKDIVIYTVGNLAQRAVILFLLPLYTNVLSVSEYGLFETIAVTSQILVFIMDLGMSRSVLRYYARYQNDLQARSKLVITALLLMTLSGVFILTIGIIGQSTFSSLLFGDSQLTQVLFWTLIVSLFQTFNLWIFILFRAKRETGKYIIVSLLNLLALTIVNIILVRYLQLGIMGVLYSQAIVYFAITIFYLPGILKDSRKYFGVSIALAKQLFNFGFPLIFTTAGMLIINSMDRYFLLHYRGLEDVGIYSLGIRIANIFSMLTVTPFQLAWGPFLFEKEKEDIRALASRFFTYFLFVLALGVTVFLLFSEEIILLFSSETFLAAKGVVPFMLISMALLGIYYWAGGIVNLAEQTWKLGLIVFVSGLCNIVLNLLLIPIWGWVGAAWANVLSRGIATGLTFILAIQLVPIYFEYKRIINVGVFIAGICTFYLFTQSTLSGISGIGIKSLVLFGGLIVLFFPLQFITPQEWAKIQNIYVSLKSKAYPSK